MKPTEPVQVDENYDQMVETGDITRDAIREEPIRRLYYISKLLHTRWSILRACDGLLNEIPLHSQRTIARKDKCHVAI